MLRQRVRRYLDELVMRDTVRANDKLFAFTDPFDAGFGVLIAGSGKLRNVEDLSCATITSASLSTKRRDGNNVANND